MSARARMAMVGMLTVSCWGCATAPGPLAAAGSKAPVDARLDTVVVVAAEPLVPGSTEAAAVTVTRGDAVTELGGVLLRGVSAGLVVEALVDDEIFERAVVYLPGAGSDVVAGDRYGYVACGSAGVVVIDFARPSRPVVLTRIDTAGAAVRLALQGNKLVIADGSGGVVMVDVSDPASPTPQATWLGLGYVRNVTFDGSRVLVSEGRAGLAVLRITKDEGLALEWRLETGGDTRAAQRFGAGWVVADGPAGLAVMGQGASGQKRVVGRLELDDTARDIAVSGQVAYVAAGGAGLLAVDLSDSARPQLRESYRGESPVNRVRLVGQRLWVGGDADGLGLYDVLKTGGLRRVFPPEDAPASEPVAASKTVSGEE